MSFFSFDTSGHNKAAPGFSQAHNPFAGLRGDEEDALEFEDTYDGLGDQLDETDDAFNDDTFGGGPAVPAKVGKDFDFFGQTAKVADAIAEEHMRFNRQIPKSVQTSSSSWPASKKRTGYEQYKDTEPVPELEADAALWGVAPKKQHAPVPPKSDAAEAADPKPGRKIMSLEEVEAAMRAQAKKPSQPEPSPVPVQQQTLQQTPAPQQHPDFLYARQQSGPLPNPSPAEHGRPLGSVTPTSHARGPAPQVTILQRPQSKQSPIPGAMPMQSQSMPGVTPHQHSQTPDPQPTQHPSQQAYLPLQQGVPPVKPTQILQNPSRPSGDANRIGVAPYPAYPGHHRQQNSFSQPVIAQPFHHAQFTEEEKSKYLEQEARRAKRNHKIFMLSKDNGLMTPQDKNFITRIQLQQLVAATGNPIEQAADDNIVEDFYYQVHTQIRGSHRQHPGQPLNNFAQTYLYQTGSRQNGARRQPRGPENHAQRMEQQVQRAVEAAKNKPKNKQLVIEGSLGKISFSNAKTPKPLLNIKRTDSSAETHRPGSSGKAHPTSATVDHKTVLIDVENVYGILMKMEDHDRKMPPPATDSGDPELARHQQEWRQTMEALNGELWRALKVHEPLGVTPVHPFIAFLSCAKGKKAIPRVFRHTTFEQRTTILTIIVIHLDQLDVIRGAQDYGHTHLNAAMREKIDLFSMAILNTLFNFMGELGLDIVTGVLGLISSLNVDLIARTRIGASMLTMVLSRAEILKQAGATQSQLDSWISTYNNFFNHLEPTLPRLFPGSVNSGQDIYVWQLLAALGIGANQDQQQRLVLGVKDRVMDTVALSRTLPPDMAQPRLQNVNLFMRSIGLDVELLV